MHSSRRAPNTTKLSTKRRLTTIRRSTRVPFIPTDTPVTSPNPAMTSPNPAMTSSNPAMTPPNPAMTSSNPAMTPTNLQALNPTCGRCVFQNHYSEGGSRMILKVLFCDEHQDASVRWFAERWELTTRESSDCLLRGDEEENNQIMWCWIENQYCV